MSYDFKLMFLYHVSMMVLFSTGQALSLGIEVAIAIGLLLVGTLLGIRHRRTTPWVWPGVSVSRLLGATVTICLAGLFLAAAVPLFPPTNPAALPWYLAAFGLFVFGTLHTLKVVAFAEADYFSPPPALGADELRWKKWVRLTFSLFFLAVWLDGVASFYCFGTAFRDGSPKPTAAQTEPLADHGKVVYVTPGQKRLVSTLQTVMAVGIPSVFLLGAVLHFIVGIKLVPNAPTLEEWRRRRESSHG